MMGNCVNPQSFHQIGTYQEPVELTTEQAGVRTQWVDSHDLSFRLRQLDEREVMRLDRKADVVMYEVTTYRDSRISSTGRIVCMLGDRYWYLSILGKPRELTNPTFVTFKVEAEPC